MDDPKAHQDEISERDIAEWKTELLLASTWTGMDVDLDPEVAPS